MRGNVEMTRFWKVALPVDLLASVLAHGCAQDLPVVGERLSVPLAQALEQLRGALDVRAEEGDGSGEQAAHACSIRSGSSAGSVVPFGS
jgi:hypothetical protein